MIVKNLKSVVLLCAIEMVMPTNIVGNHLNYGAYAVVCATKMENQLIKQQNIDRGTVESTLLLKRQEKDLVNFIAVWNVEWTAILKGCTTYAIHP